MASRPRTSQQKAQSSRKRAGNPPATSPSSNKTLLFVVGAVIVIVVIAAVYLMLTSSPSDETNGENNNGNTPSTTNPIAVIETSMGTIQVELFEDKVPDTVENFMNLANDGFYDGLVFHRVIDDFMIQGGGFEADGTQKESPYGTIDLEINEEVRHVDGAISMARTNEPNSATSQFFICDGVQSFLDDSYAAFGVTIEGLDVVQEIAALDPEHTTTKHGMENWPIDDVFINSITIENQY